MQQSACGNTATLKYPDIYFMKSEYITMM